MTRPVDSVASSFLPILLSEFLEENPGVRFKVAVRRSSRVWQELEELDGDIGFNFLPKEPLSASVLAKYSLRIGLSVARDHPIAARDKVSLKEALEYPVVADSISAPALEKVRKLSIAEKTHFVPWIETDSTSMIKNLIETGRFISLRTILFSVGYDRSSLRTVWRPLIDDLPSETLVVAVRNLEKFSEETQQFASYTRRFLDKSLHQDQETT